MTAPRRTSNDWSSTQATSVVAATSTRARALPRSSRRTASIRTKDRPPAPATGATGCGRIVLRHRPVIPFPSFPVKPMVRFGVGTSGHQARKGSVKQHAALAAAHDPASRPPLFETRPDITHAVAHLARPTTQAGSAPVLVYLRARNMLHGHGKRHDGQNRRRPAAV